MISFSAVFVKLAHVGPTVAGFYRMLFGGLILTAIVLARREKLWFTRWSAMLCVICGLIFAADLFFWHRSIHLIGPGLSTMLANFQVFFLGAFGVVILRERIGGRLAISILLAIIGLAMIVGVDFSAMTSGYRLGVIFGLLTALSYASYLIVFRKLQAGTKLGASFLSVAVISVTSALALGLVGFIEGKSFRVPDVQSLLSLVGYGLAGQVIGWVLIARGLPLVRASNAGLILLLQPAMAFVWDVLFFGRPTAPIEVVGAFVALTAIYLGSLSRPERDPTVG
jgi:drug/metabolite transporter (DMT)-like permease